MKWLKGFLFVAFFMAGLIAVSGCAQGNKAAEDPEGRMRDVREETMNDIRNAREDALEDNVRKLGR